MDTGSVFEGEVLYEELYECTFLRRISQKEGWAFKWAVNSILDSLKNRTICSHVDNMYFRQAWLNSGSISFSWLNKQII